MKKYLASVIFGVLAFLFILAGGFFYFSVFKHLPGSSFIRIMIAIITVGLAGSMIIVLLQRLKELKEEDKDVISKY